MKISLNWINQYVKVDDLDPEEIAHQLSVRTCEVEAVLPYGQDLDGIILGKVMECQKHPNADRLFVTKVDVGGEVLQIVCGAQNVAQGQSVAVAKPGVLLPGGTKLKVCKLRGVESHGMILSEKEMGIGEDEEGIFVLESQAKPGTPFYEVNPVRDWTFEIDNKSITHRPDLWGHYGFAREIAAIFQRPLAPLVGKKLSISKAEKPFPITVEDPKGCPRYLALLIEDIGIGPAPGWLQRRLRAVGQRPINNIVDLTNFILLEIGQPTHAFDRSRIRGGKILVRRAHGSEELVTLDGAKRKLSPSDLLIADPQGPLAIAGVMGAANSEISTTTKEIVLESACFDAISVRRTSQRLCLRTEASSRFEKSLDPNYASLAVQRFAELIPRVCPEANVVSLNDHLADPDRGIGKTRTISLSTDLVQRRLGCPISEKEVSNLLRRLEFQVQGQGQGGALQVTVPSFRATKDITLEEDLVEEIGRLHGYEKIVDSPLVAPVVPPPHEDERILVRKIKERLAKGYAFTEALHYSFLPNSLAKKLEIDNFPYVVLENPMLQEHDRVRRSVLPSLLGSVESALRLHEEIRLFEIGKGYRPDRETKTGEPLEFLELGAVWAWKEKPEGAPPFYHAKGLFHSLLSEFRVSNFEEREFGKNPIPEVPFLNPRHSIQVVSSGDLLGFYGEIDPKFKKNLSIHGVVYALWLDLRILLRVMQGIYKFQALPKYPGISVDVAVAVPPSVSYRKVEQGIHKKGGKYLSKLEHFDSFRMKDGRKSFAFHALLLSSKRTLTDKEEADFIERVAEAAKSLGGELRR